MPPATASLDELAQRSIIAVELEPETPATHHVGKGFITLFTLAYFGFFLIVMPLAIISIALKINTLVAPKERAGWLGLILGIGGIFGLVLAPIFGKMSDRTTSILGMRRTYLLGGLVFSVAGSAIMASAPNVGMVLVGFLVAALGQSVGAALAGVLPDQVPFSQRGVVSGLMGIALPLGMVGGPFIVQLFAMNMLLVFLVPTLIGAALIALFALKLKDRKLDPADRPAL
jgi:MFS family permease